MTDTLNGTPQPDRIFIQLAQGTILDLIDVKKAGDGISGWVQNGRYPVELIDGVLFIPNTKHEPATNVRIIYEGAPPIDRPDYYGPAISWIEANEGKWISA